IADSATTDAGDAVGSTRYDTELDVARAVERLTPMQRRICTMIGEEGLSVKETAERLRIPRGTLYEELKRIRQTFSIQGLGDYLKD
ncbi:MAG: sigma-70 family RNA polymerase sigma factor, partial [Gemmatimonadaceae bacterium]|nr:sigma-70 family RNA polymerase sigma factor [Gemmatimonadaceae bacterium]